ncbi:hypothetical protein GTY56_27820 [Streptomyces sp. SID5643]|nr:hypothetical protein [Streptomyces sp. SID5643]
MPGANSEGIDLQLFRTDHKKLKQSDDRSFYDGPVGAGSSRRATAGRPGSRAPRRPRRTTRPSSSAAPSRCG